MNVLTRLMTKPNTTGTLEELLTTACEYGRVWLMQHSDGDWLCTIKFHTIKHVELEAKSGFNNATPQDALRKAIEKAEQIRSQFK